MTSDGLQQCATLENCEGRYNVESYCDKRLLKRTIKLEIF